jgi:hypothetical protein
MTAHEVADTIVGMLSEAEYDDESEFFESYPFDRITSCEEAGVLTTDAGFVVRTADGSEFQITVVQSR